MCNPTHHGGTAQFVANFHDTRIHRPLLGAMCDDSTFSPSPVMIVLSVSSAFSSTSMTSSSITATAVSDSVGLRGLVVGWLFSFSFFSCCLRSLEGVLRNFSHGFLLVCVVGRVYSTTIGSPFQRSAISSFIILSWSKTIPSRSASGLGGHWNIHVDWNNLVHTFCDGV